MWDLTITPSHDFYIQTSDTAVLVHNICGDAEDGDQADALRSAVNDRASEVIENQSNSERGPVLTGAMDRETGEVFFGQNTGIPEPLAPELQSNLDNSEGPGALFRGVPGAHSEINALNQGLFARFGAE